jgi:hypothetical protein
MVVLVAQTLDLCRPADGKGLAIDATIAERADFDRH